MKHTLISIFLIAAIPCSAQWRNANFNGQVLAFGVHDTNFFWSDVLGPGFHLVYRFAPTSPNGWFGVDNGMDTAGEILQRSLQSVHIFLQEVDQQVQATVILLQIMAQYGLIRLVVRSGQMERIFLHNMQLALHALPIAVNRGNIFRIQLGIIMLVMAHAFLLILLIMVSGIQVTAERPGHKYPHHLQERSRVWVPFFLLWVEMVNLWNLPIVEYSGLQ